MKKRIIIIIIIIFILTFFILMPKIKDYIEQQRIKNATIIVELKDNLKTEFLNKTRVSDFIININGDIINDYLVDTTKVGTQKINFEYINEEDIKIPYSFNIKVVDNTSPIIWLSSSYNILTTYKGNLEEDIMCGDNADDNPDCKIEGQYDISVAGDYPLTFIATDASGNQTKKNFTLKVREPSQNKTPISPQEPVRTNLNDVITNHKNENTKIGIDVSRWQEDIDFEKVKNAGVEFVFIKVGGTIGIDGEYYTDVKFQQNIEGFNKVGIPVGIYFYSYAATSTQAKEDAEWLLKQIKDYKVDLPIVYDWENWSSYNDFNMSFYNLTNNAKVFLDTVKASGYDGLLYSSKSYLEKIWLDIDYPIWLAHYTSKSDYEGEYSYWQMCDNGLVDGINANVDIDIMYIKES